MSNLFLITILFLSMTFHEDNHFDILGKYKLSIPSNGEATVTFSSDSTFEMLNQGGVARIINEGTYEVYLDSIFLTYTSPSISNGLDTFLIENHYQKRRDTLWALNENEIVTGTHIMSDRYYQYEKHYETGFIKVMKEWALTDSSYIKEDRFGDKHIYDLRGVQIPAGSWKYYDREGVLIREEDKTH